VRRACRPRPAALHRPRLLTGVPCAAETRQTGRRAALVQVRHRSTTSATPTHPAACRRRAGLPAGSPRHGLPGC
jgi:hypothetical protein